MGGSQLRMSSNGIPAYSRTMTSDVVATLTVRPTYTGDFPGGITVGVGTPVAWGQNIGFSANTCVSPTPTAGYYPKGPSCPSSQGGTPVVFPLTPAPASTPETTGGRVGYFVNGVAAFNWGDAQSYNNQNVWFRTAFHWELYDMDIDSGHASSNGLYHHHFYSGALATYVGDTGAAHSPIHGFAADGYPIHGPWHSSGVLAVSGWQTRDYSEGSVTGCGTGNANKRRCLMNDQTNKNGGVAMLTTASQYGPDTNAVVNTATGRPVTTVSGVFAEDYYFDSTVCGSNGQCLDKHNGHSHDTYGYHYHTTVTQESDLRLTPRFPFITGLQYYGTLPTGSFGDQRPGMWAP
jgi:hypothetical protein